VQRPSNTKVLIASQEKNVKNKKKLVFFRTLRAESPPNNWDTTQGLLQKWHEVSAIHQSKLDRVIVCGLFNYFASRSPQCA
jgi:hypothetical protein